MPFKSKAQARYLFAKHSAIAREFAEVTPSFEKLPERKRKKKNGKNKSHHR
jgi:hypothetical protein